MSCMVEKNVYLCRVINNFRENSIQKVMTMNCKLLMLGVLLVLTACGGKKEQKSEDNGVNKHTEEYILQRIDTIYKTVGKATVDAEGNRVDYIASDFNRDSAYCSQRYYALMQQALEVCEKTGEVLYDYDHWVCGQDFSEDWSYKVKKVYQVTDSTALVDLTIHNFNDKETTIALRFECDDWYIDDFSPSEDGEDDKAYLRRVIQQGEEAQGAELTFDNMAGIYDDEKQESRFCLMSDGTATWGMIGSLNFTEYTYRISGNTICLKPKDVDSEEDCYKYDPKTRTLKNEQGSVYYRQEE